MGKDKCEELLEDLKRRKGNRTYNELTTVLAACGFESKSRKHGGSHVVWFKGSEWLTLPDPGKKKPLPVGYALQVIKVIERANILERGYEEDD